MIREHKYANGTNFRDSKKHYRLDWREEKYARYRPFETNKDNSCLVRSFPKGMILGNADYKNIDNFDIYPIFAKYYLDDLAKRSWT